MITKLAKKHGPYWRKAVLSVTLLLLALSATAQQLYKLDVRTLDQPSTFLKETLKVDYGTTFGDSLSMLQELQKLLFTLQEQAYLTASIDSISKSDSIHVAHLYVGKMYQWGKLLPGKIDEAFLSQVGFRERLYSNKPFSYKEVRELQENLLEYAENNGYPFAAVWLDEINIREGKVDAKLSMEKNRLIQIEGINIIGEVKITDTYLENYLGLKKGALYNKEKILKIRNRIRELPFLKEKRNATVTFKQDRATINLFLEKQASSRWDFIIGILPNSDQSGKLRLTGSFTGELQNQFGIGEEFYVDFQRLRPGIQELDLRFSYPYVLKLPVGIDLRFEQYRRDSLYRDIKADFGLQYLFEGGNYLRAYWNSVATTLLTIDGRDIIRDRKLPDNLDITNTSFGLEYQLQQLDYRFNPRKGWSVWLRGGTGNKRIKPNGNIIGLVDEDDPTFNFGSLYDSLDLNSLQYKLDARLETYIPLFKRNTLKLGVQGGILFSEEDIFRNEQYRLGGNRLLRGFDEESIFATRYAVMTLEYRFLIGQNSYLYAFGDYGYVENLTATRRRFDNPIGLGAGMTFEVKVGVFGISLAVGSTRDLPFNFRDVKTHLGYVSYF